MARHKIAVIPGDGIGKEVVPEGLRVLDAAARRFGIELQLDHFDWSCDYYARHGSMMPSSWKELIGQHDALFFGAVGWPATVPDHVSLWGMLIKFRREFDQYVNLRPCRLMPGIRTPLPIASRVTSTSSSCARTPRASIPAWAAACTKGLNAKSYFNRRAFPERELIGF